MTESYRKKDGAKRPARIELIQLPDQCSRYLDDTKRMARPDFEFLTNLLGGYGIQLDRQTDAGRTKIFGRREFFEATSTVVTYVQSLRQELDIGFVNHYQKRLKANAQSRAPKTERELWIEGECKRPSAGRITDLCYLFLHIPQVKAESTRVHAKKMTDALPRFRETLSNFDHPLRNRKDFFDSIKLRMIVCLQEQASKMDPKENSDLGFLMHYQSGFMMHPEESGRFFANSGVDTFINSLSLIVELALINGEVVKEKAEEEFTNTDSATYKQMRMSLRALHNLLELSVSGMDLGKVGERANYSSGICPATTRVPSADKSSSKRPLAYEYAASIIDAMPPELLAA